MATATQIANKIKQRQIDAINEELEGINKTLRKYEPLFELKKQLEGARRALLSERAPTAGGGRGLTMEEIVNALGELGEATVDQVATKLNASPGAVRAHFNRGAGERYNRTDKGGVILWSVRDPEEQNEPVDDEDEDDE
jgi:hypothetical protein